MVWGKHIIIDATGCDYEAIRNINWIEDFVDELIFKTKMKKWGKMYAMYLAPDNDNTLNDTAGWSVCQFITTSNITIHFAETSKSLYLDFFSCKDFNNNDVVELVRKYFTPSKITTRFIDRDALRPLVVCPSGRP